MNFEKKAEEAKKQGKVHVKLVSDKGLESLFLSPEDAVCEIKKLNSEDSKWVYVDKLPVKDMDNLTEELLKNAQDITLTNQIRGGNKSKKVLF